MQGKLPWPIQGFRHECELPATSQCELQKQLIMTGSFKKILLTIVAIACSLLLIAQQDVSVVLRINHQEKLSVYRDQPLVISLSISNPKASGHEQWNRQADYEIAQLEQNKRNGQLSDEQYNSERQRLQAGKKQVPAYSLGSASMPSWEMVKFRWIKDSKEQDINIGTKLLNSEQVPAELTLDANGWYRLQWGIDRTSTWQLKPGKYYLSVVIDRYNSNTVELEIKPIPIPVSTLNTETMQLDLARFALLCKRPDTAIVHAKKALSINPKSISALVLLGEAYIQTRNYASALQYFETALTYFNKQSPSAHEPPEYILEMIEWLKRQ